MKKLKKFLAMMISMVMVLSMATASFATPAQSGNLTITLQGGNKLPDGESHTVRLYKLLNLASYSGDKYSYSLNEDYKETIKTILNCSENEIIGKIAAYKDKGEDIKRFAKKFEENYKGGKCTTANITAPSDRTTVSQLEPGYYLIVLDNASQINPVITTVNGDATINLKEEAPSIDKKAFDKDGKPATDVQIGDIVTYTITTTIPKKFTTYKITDTLSKGLNFVNFDGTDITVPGTLKINVKLRDKGQLEGGTDITGTCGIVADVAKNQEQKEEMTIDLKDYINKDETQRDYIGKTLIITYKAKVNAEAQVTEKNSAKLEYGNNPDKTITTKPEEVKTPTFPVHIKKTDKANKTSFLSGAEFELYPDNGGQAGTTAIKVIGSGGVYKINPNQSEEPGNIKLVTIDEIKTKNFDKTGGYNLVINGLKAGTYWLRETKAPDGYNLLKNDIKITVTNNKDGSYEISKDDIKAEKNIITIENTSGVHLPETGGTGTLLLTAVGALLVAVAMIRFMRRKQEN